MRDSPYTFVLQMALSFSGAVTCFFWVVARSAFPGTFSLSSTHSMDASRLLVNLFSFAHFETLQYFKRISSAQIVKLSATSSVQSCNPTLLTSAVFDSFATSWSRISPAWLYQGEHSATPWLIVTYTQSHYSNPGLYFLFYHSPCRSEDLYSLWIFVFHLLFFFLSVFAISPSFLPFFFSSFFFVFFSHRCCC